jgi:ribosomal RNA-processing protein 12
MMSLEEKLTKIKSPNLESQKHARNTLNSIEETLNSQKIPATPAAYFAAALAILKQGASNNNAENEVVTSATYLLDLITSNVAASLLRSQFNTIVGLLAPHLSSSQNNAPLARSVIGCLETLLIAQDAAAWALPQTQTSPRQAVQALLGLAVDQRPKVRKRSQEAIIAVLKNPPPSPTLDHPAAELCAIAAQNNLKNAVDAVQQARRNKGRPDDSHDPALIHALQLTRTIATASGGWPSMRIEQLCELLLSISRSKSDYLVINAFEVFEIILDGMKDEVSSAKLPRLLEAIIELKPAQNDAQLLPPWIAVISRGYGTAAEVEPEDTFAKLPELFDLMSPFLTSYSHNIRVSASECLISFFANCIPDSVIGDPSVYDEKILEQLSTRALALMSVRYQTAWMEVFTMLSALFDALRWRGDPYLLPLVQSIGDLRSNDGFQGKRQADEVLGRAIRNLGPAAVLSVLPHNLISPKAGHPGRAWLLPLLRDHVSNTNLAHFKADLVPLSGTMFQRVLDHGSSEKTMDIKIFETVVNQVWATFPGYCDLPIDLTSTFDQALAELLSNLLYQQTELRVDICRGLQNLVESNQALIASDLSDEILLVERRISRAQAEANIAHLSTLASNLLAVLFNVYSQTLPQSRYFILQCINAYLSITSNADLVSTFTRVAQMFEAELPKPDALIPPKQPQQQPSRTKMPPTSHTLLDLIIALSLHLPRSTFASLFALANSLLTNPIILKTDPQLIKKSYKLIPRMSTSPTGGEALQARNPELRQLIMSTASTTPVPARRDRLLAISTLINYLADTELHFIPSTISEIVLACKDSNVKTRTVGFDLLIQCSDKIIEAGKSGGVIRNSLVPGMPEGTVDVSASVGEVFGMVSAGLAGSATHVVAASITSLSRLIFEYHGLLSKGEKEEILDTVVMFLESKNREIVRSVLGFVKVVVVVLDIDILQSRMEGIMKGCMVWSKENKGRLRQKVRGIIDRALRRWDGTVIESWVGTDDRKMVVNIRKRKERNKRKKAGAAEEEEEDETPKGEYDNELDEALYNSSDSDSEIMGEDDDDTMSGVSFKQSKQKPKNRRGGDQYIREDSDDEPLDLLDPSSLSNITSRKLGRLRDQRNGRRKARLNEDGKLVFGDGADKDVLMGNGEAESGSGAVNSYLTAVAGPDAVRKGAKGKLKVKSSQKRGADGGGDEMEVDDDDARAVSKHMNHRRLGSGGSTGSFGRSRGEGGRGGGRGGNDHRNARRGLGMEKQRGPSQGGAKFRSGRGVGKRGRGNVRFHGGRGGRR